MAAATAEAAAPLCSQCRWQTPVADTDRCIECAAWRIGQDVCGIPGRSLLARQPLALGCTILTEPLQLWHCDIDPSCRDLSVINRAPNMEGAYRQLIMQVAASVYIEPACAAAAPSNSVLPSDARRRFEQLHSVSESEFLGHHAEDDEQGRQESLRAVEMAKEVFAIVEAACSSSSSASPSSSSSSPSPSVGGVQLCASESDFVSALIRFKLNAWSFHVPRLCQMRINIVPHIAAANHSCCPNSVVIEGRSIVALRDIAQDEPITLSYLGIAALRSLDTAERRRRLWKDWIFRCECARCTTEGMPTQRNWERELQQIEDAAAKLARSGTSSDDDDSDAQQDLSASEEEAEEDEED